MIRRDVSSLISSRLTFFLGFSVFSCSVTNVRLVLVIGPRPSTAVCLFGSYIRLVLTFFSTDIDLWLVDLERLTAALNSDGHRNDFSFNEETKKF